MTSQVLPFANFTRGGFGKSRNTTKTSENDEDWYIPYNGPYEAPRGLPDRRKARDSWGDLVEPDEEEDDTVLHDRELHLRYGGHNNPTDRKNGARHVEGVRVSRGRDRSFSVTSGHTVLSGTIDPSRPNMGTTRRPTLSTETRPAVPSYINLDAVGGVGESPIPRRSPKEGSRLSLAGIFNFNTQPRKPSPPTAAPVARSGSSSFMRKSSLLQRSNMRTVRNGERIHNKIDSPMRYSSSPEHHANPPMRDKHQQLHHQVTSQADRLSSDATEEDYYHSYYSTLIREQRSEPVLNRHRHSPSMSEDVHRSQQSPFDQSSLDRQNSASTSSGHPYAIAIPRDNIESVSTPPVIPPSNPPVLTFTAPSHHSSSIDPRNLPSARLVSPRTPKLTSSISTPDMRKSAALQDAVVVTAIPNTDMIPQQIAAPQFVFPKVNRWLAAETWCDALLFPRPRLRVENVSTPGGSGRIVSPPGSPLEPDFANSTTREPGVASRVLAHSRSLVDLNKPTAFSSYTYPHVSPSTSHGQNSQAYPAGTQSRRPPWPGGFAQDDLALPTVVPSLEHILEQGQKLADEREAWQTQAKNSFGNQRTRTLSRTRSKSLTQKGRRRGHQVQTSMEYLAAQACLGNQNSTSNLRTTEFGVILHDTTYTSSLPKSSHSHSSSHARTLSKSSKSHSKGDSWSKSAAKMAKSTVAFCGFSASEEEVAERDVQAASLEGALKRDGTKVIRLPDPAYIPVDYGLPYNTSPNNSTRLTPSPSDNNDQGVGIALGTPLEDDQGDPIYLPSHPYARGGSGFAGPHPSINSGVDIPQISDILARHRLPPHLLLHPYAQASARDSYLEQNGLLAQYRSNDDTPKQMKMWAQLSPGVLREVLPGDIQYSPLSPETDNLSPVSTNSIHIRDTIGVGETLANAAHFRRNPDKTIGTNDSDAHVMAAKPIAQADLDKQSQNSLPEFGPRTIRKPVEYDLSPSEDSEVQGPSLANQVVSTSPEQPPIQVTDRAASASPTSASSSPFLTPHRLGSLHDLESFQDLFYRPNNNLQQTSNEAALPDTPSPPHITTAAWDRSMQRHGSHRTESGLTSLARQLSQEFELMALERGMSGSQYSSQPPSSRQQSSTISKRRADGSLEFFFEEAGQSGLPPELDHSAIHAFQPSGSLPEDVESSRASSLIERLKEGDDTTMVRLGVIESALTPPTVPPQHRPNSYTGETSCVTTNNEGCQQDQAESSHAPGVSSEARARTLSGLRPPSSEATRTSVVSTSTVSRMSNLSDFPAPPKDNHMSLGAYFNEALSQSELRSKVPLPPCPQDQQVFFGRNQDAGDLAKTLSSVS